MNRETIMENTYIWIARRLPKRLLYFATLEVWGKTTSGKYENTLICELTVDEALRRYMVKYDL